MGYQDFIWINLQRPNTFQLDLSPTPICEQRLYLKYRLLHEKTPANSVSERKIDRASARSELNWVKPQRLVELPPTEPPWVWSPQRSDCEKVGRAKSPSSFHKVERKWRVQMELKMSKDGAECSSGVERWSAKPSYILSTYRTHAFTPQKRGRQKQDVVAGTCNGNT